MLQAIYAQTHPAHLKLYISNLPDFLSQADGLVRLFAHRNFGTTQSLTLTFDILWSAKDVDFGLVLVRAEPLYGVLAEC